MTAALLDTDVLLEYREGRDEDVVAFVVATRAAGAAHVSQASALALLGWCRDEGAQAGVDAFLATVTVHPVSAAVSRKAFSLLRSLPPRPPLSPVDALVAATAVIQKLPLYALDPGRYAAVPGLTALPAR